MHQYDVSDPMNPVLAGKVNVGGIVAHHKHPNGKDFAYGPQMVEISRTVSAFIGQTLCIQHGMINFIRMTVEGKWSWHALEVMVALSLIRISMLISRKAIAVTKFALKVETVQRIVSVTRTSK